MSDWAILYCRTIDDKQIRGETTPWKRRIMFITSIFAFWRCLSLYRKINLDKPDCIWMHSILRYYGIWWVLAVHYYARKSQCQVFLSHHDVWLMAPFPQWVMSEWQIPKSYSLWDFLWGLTVAQKSKALFKWIYVLCISSYLPENTTHIIFSPFLEKHIRNHFPWDNCLIVPHTFDETLFYPKD